MNESYFVFRLLTSSLLTTSLSSSPKMLPKSSQAWSTCLKPQQIKNKRN